MIRYTMTQDKNIIVLAANDTDTGKSRDYYFDINTATLTNGQKRIMDGWPQGFTTFVRGHNWGDNTPTMITLLIYCINHPNRLAFDGRNYNYCMWKPSQLRAYADTFKLLDKMQSVGYRMDWNDTEHFNARDLKLIETNFRKFAQYLRENPENPNIRSFLENNRRTLWFAQYPELENYHLTEEMKNGIYQQLTSWRANNPDAKMVKVFAYHVSRGLAAFLGGYGYAYDKLREYIQYCEFLDLDPYAKCDFYREYVTVKRNYEIHKKEVQDKKIAEYQSSVRDVLEFEDDTFKVIVPMTAAEFEQEANEQHNCVYSMYMDKVAKSQTHVVFVRRKNNPEKSYITCEVSNFGTIQQYLLRYNERVKDEDACEFRILYERHLHSLWK